MAKKRNYHPLFRKWTHIRQVIFNPQYPGHNPDLECRGLNNFTQFRRFVESEIGTAPPGRHLLNRLRKDRGWIKGNISWGDHVEVAKCSRFSYIIRYKGEHYTVKEFGKLTGIHSATLYARLRTGQSLAKISGLEGVKLEKYGKTQRSI